MRTDMSPEQVRAAGIYLNGGRRRGWKLRLAALLDTPQTTVSAWSTRSAGNARPIPGVAAVAIKLLVAMMRQELMVTAHPGQARDAMTERLLALLAQPQPLAEGERQIPVENLDRPSGSVERAPLLKIKRPGALPEQRIAPRAENDPPERPIPLAIGPGERSGSSSSA